MSRFEFVVVVFVVFVLVAPGSRVRAAIPQVGWESVEIIDAPVSDVSTSSGVSVLSASGVWHVVYEKSGEIFTRARADSGWLAPQQVSVDSSGSRAPHIALGGDFLHVVWEDERSGHPEAWTRRWNEQGWSAEECLSCDTVASFAPVIGGDGDGGGFVFAAWEEDATPERAILGRRFRWGAWFPVDLISQSTAAAIEPSVTVSPSTGNVSVVWSDARHGQPEIYLRQSIAPMFWSAEERVTDLAGSCRRPSAHAQECCPDIGYDVFGFAFENDQTGVSEIFGSCWAQGTGAEAPQRLSADDGTPSTRPNLAGFNVLTSSLPPGGVRHVYLPSWTDGAPSEDADVILSHSEQCVFPSEDMALVSDSSVSYSAVGAIEGNPNAEVLVAWVEERDGVPTLVAQRGLLLGYVGVEASESASDAPRLTAAPNPSRTHVTLRLDSPAAARADVRLIDAAGRVVRNLGSWPLASGTNAIRWDLRDDSGVRVASGRYIATATVNGTVLREKLLIAR